jgi:MFS superfamily sulfate permease-like transporter
VVESALALALVASAETLLSANAVDRLHNGRRTKYDRELMAQGFGNVLCGLVGALPMTGVIARSSVNVYAGAKSRASAILHGVWLLVFVACLPQLLGYVPIASLAALLLVTSVKLIDVAAVKKLWSYGWRLVTIYAATVLCIVCTDLLTGVMVGVVLSLAKLLYTMSRLGIRKIACEQSRRITLQLQGAATFVSLPKLANALEALPIDCELHICLDNLDYVDHACLELLMDWEKQHESAGGSLVIDWGELNAVFKFKGKRRAIEIGQVA